jgi:hypothetical protein
MLRAAMRRLDIVIRNRQKHEKDKSPAEKDRNQKCAMRKETTKKKKKWDRKSTRVLVPTTEKKKISEEQPACFCSSKA